MKAVSHHLSWLIPLAITLVIGFAQVYALQGKVDRIEKANETEGRQALIRLAKLEERVKIIDEFCCGECGHGETLQR